MISHDETGITHVCRTPEVVCPAYHIGYRHSTGGGNIDDFVMVELARFLYLKLLFFPFKLIF